MLGNNNNTGHIWNINKTGVNFNSNNTNTNINTNKLYLNNSSLYSFIIKLDKLILENDYLNYKLKNIVEDYYNLSDKEISFYMSYKLDNKIKRYTQVYSKQEFSSLKLPSILNTISLNLNFLDILNNIELNSTTNSSNSTNLLRFFLESIFEIKLFIKVDTNINTFESIHIGSFMLDLSRLLESSINGNMFSEIGITLYEYNGSNNSSSSKQY